MCFDIPSKHQQSLLISPIWLSCCYSHDIFVVSVCGEKADLSVATNVAVAVCVCVFVCGCVCVCVCVCVCEREGIDSVC